MQIEYKLYRIKQLIELLNISRSTIWLWIKQDQFPEPIKLGKNTTVWKSSEIDECIKNKESK